MNFTLTNIAAAMSTIQSDITASVKVYEFVTDMMVTAEKAYAQLQVENVGASKLALVLMATRDFVLKLGENWDAIVGEITAWINAVKAAFNAAKAAVA